MSRPANRRGMVTPYERKDGSLSYRLKWWERGVDGKRVQRQRTFATEAAALDHKAKIRTAQSEGTHTTRKAGKTPLGELGREWLESKSLKSAGTLRTYSSLYRNHVEPAFAETPIAAITSKDVQAWVYDRMEQLKPSSLERVYRCVLSPIFSLAVSRRCIAESPCSSVISLPFIDPQEQRHCSTSEVHVLANAIESHGYSSLTVLFLAYTGLRYGEFAGLKVKHVDLDDRTVRVEGQVTEGADGVWGFTRKLKTKKARRVVGIPAWLADRLAVHLEGHTSEYLFCESDSGFVRYGKFTGALERARKGVGLDDVHVHSLRHTYAALAIARGVDLFHISRLMGHASISVTEGTYGHLCTESIHRIADVMELASMTTPRLVSVN